MGVEELVVKDRLESRLKREEYKSRVVDTLRLKNIAPALRHYRFAVIDSTACNPFIADREMLEVSRELTSGLETQRDKAYAIYEWAVETIHYDHEKARGYRDSLQVKKQSRGVCGESGFLYVVMARLSSLESAFVKVSRDHLNRKVNHACASVMTEERQILADVAYRRFDVKHREYRILSDSEAIRRFISWKNAG